MFVGLFSMAFFAAFNYIPVIPEMIEATKAHQRQEIVTKYRLEGLDEQQIDEEVCEALE